MFTDKSKKVVSLVLGTALIASGISVQNTDVVAAKKATLAKKTIKVTKGNTATIKIKNKNKKATYKFASSKKAVASVNKKGVVTAKKAGTAKITVTEKLKKKNRKLGKVKVVVKAATKKNENVAPTASAATENTAAPVASETPAATSTAAAQESATPVASDVPVSSETPVVTETPAPTETPVVTEAPWNVDIEFTCPKNYCAEGDGDYPEYTPIKYYSTTVGKERKANVILPKNYDPENKKYPVLYLLHGISGDENEWKSGTANIIVQNVIDNEGGKEAIVVLVNQRARTNDSGTNEMSLDHFKAHDNFINDLRDDLMPYINSNYATLTDRNNTAIAGLSMGGRESLYIGLSMPEQFGYIGAFEPAPGVLASNDESGLFTEDTLKVADEYKNRTFLMVIKGTHDTTVGDNPLLYHNALTKNGTPHFYTETGGFNTNGSDGGGAHGWQVWKSSLYVFYKNIFNH